MAGSVSRTILYSVPRNGGIVARRLMTDKPTHIDLKRERGLTVQWEDGSEDFFPLAYLRRMSPSADAKTLRDEIARNPLVVLPASGSDRPLTAVGAELVGNYAIRIRFSDGHETGIYSWSYLRELRKGLQTTIERPAPSSRPGEAT